MDLIMTVLFVLVAYHLGKFIIAWLDLKTIEKEVQRDSVIKVLDKMIREVKVENYHGLSYWFDKENDRFLAQGETNQEIISVLKTRFPDNVFLLPDGQVLGAPNWQPGEKTEAKITQAMFDKFVNK